MLCYNKVCCGKVLNGKDLEIGSVESSHDCFSSLTVFQKISTMLTLSTLPTFYNFENFDFNFVNFLQIWGNHFSTLAKTTSYWYCKSDVQITFSQKTYSSWDAIPWIRCAPGNVFCWKASLILKDETFLKIHLRISINRKTFSWFIWLFKERF